MTNPVESLRWLMAFIVVSFQKLRIQIIERPRIKRNALVTCNQLRVAFGCAPLGLMPAGTQQNSFICPQHVALEGLGLGTFRVTHNLLEVDHIDEAFADIIEAAWGTTISLGPTIMTAVLPPSMQAFVRAFDAGEIPELVAA